MIFISHSSKDKPFVRKLVNDLSVYNIAVWFDEDKLSLGDHLDKKISNAIENNYYIGVVISSHSINSKWVEKELEIAEEQKTLGKCIITVPILIEKIEIPESIRHNLYADFTGSGDKEYHIAFHQLLKILGFKPNSNKDLVIYFDGLQVGWENASWNCSIKVNSTECVHGGKYSIKAKIIQKYGGVAFSFQSGIDTRYYSNLEFLINGGEYGGQKLKVYFNDALGNGVRNPVSLDILKPRTWKLISIPLENLDAENIVIFKINFSDEIGKIQTEFYLDKIKLTV